ncbi:hypothetical protein GLYMA_17G163233v4 [Glycine max]|nr:hypothetical protein GLYMA_17G163233v4 [Glycine max]KAH1118719.1 hypothetical protein GYH30_047482 [Glycine max]
MQIRRSPLMSSRESQRTNRERPIKYDFPRDHRRSWSLKQQSKKQMDPLIAKPKTWEGTKRCRWMSMTTGSKLYEPLYLRLLFFFFLKKRRKKENTYTYFYLNLYFLISI